jgi:hypothetical protein
MRWKRGRRDGVGVWVKSGNAWVVHIICGRG